MLSSCHYARAKAYRDNSKSSLGDSDRAMRETTYLAVIVVGNVAY